MRGELRSTASHHGLQGHRGQLQPRNSENSYLIDIPWYIIHGGAIFFEDDNSEKKKIGAEEKTKQNTNCITFLLLIFIR